jgi:serine/threonine protein kinase
MISELTDEKISIKVIDFGSAAYYDPNDLRYEVVGTPINYSPEIIQGLFHTPSMDYWNIGKY